VKKIRASKIFIAGGQPSLTYVDRDNTDTSNTLEDGIRSYLDAGFKALTVTGPTKSGKTVLCRKVIGKENAFWLSGGNIQAEGDFWDQITEQLDTPLSETASLSSSTSKGANTEVGLELGINAIAKLTGKAGGSGETGRVATKSATKNRNVKTVAVHGLIERGLPIIIDDFHYIERPIQKAIIRSLKDPIFDGLRVILIAVPHRAFDAVRSEREMTGRVDQLPVELWSKNDLTLIADQGFPPLNVKCAPEIINDFIEESLGSPHLMQEFCRQLCEANGVSETQDTVVKLELPHRTEFFKKIPRSTAKPAFDLLARGPRQRSDRKQRTFIDESKGDIYLAVLRAIANTGAKSRLTYEDLRFSLRTILSDEMPQAHEIGRVLVQMTEIAKNKIEGEAVLEWDEEETILHVADPFFAFYLRWLDK
jgi:hypothetical protein